MAPLRHRFGSTFFLSDELHNSQDATLSIASIVIRKTFARVKRAQDKHDKDGYFAEGVPLNDCVLCELTIHHIS